MCLCLLQGYVTLFLFIYFFIRDIARYAFTYYHLYMVFIMVISLKFTKELRSITEPWIFKNRIHNNNLKLKYLFSTSQKTLDLMLFSLPWLKKGYWISPWVNHKGFMNVSIKLLWPLHMKRIFSKLYSILFFNRTNYPLERLVIINWILVLITASYLSYLL